MVSLVDPKSKLYPNMLGNNNKALKRTAYGMELNKTIF